MLVDAKQQVEASIPVVARYAEGNEVSPAERSGLIVLTQLEEVEAMASLFMTVKDIMICLEIPLCMQDDFIEILETDYNNPIFKAYHTGRLNAEIELRTSIKMAALNGSNPAQNSMLNYNNQSKL